MNRKDYFKEIYIAERDDILAHRKAWYQANKDRILEQRKEYKEANKAKINAQNRERYRRKHLTGADT